MLILTACGNQDTGTLHFVVDKIEGQQVIKINGKNIKNKSNDITLAMNVGKHKLEINILSEDGNWEFSDVIEFEIEKDKNTYFLADLKRKPTQKQKEIIQKQKELIELGNSKPKDNKRYKDNNDNTITDTVTNLMWKKCAEGIVGDSCDQGIIKKFTFNDAMEHAKKSQFAGYSDWRIPTYAELKTLVDCPQGIGKEILFNDAGYLVEKNGIASNGECTVPNEKPTINQNAFPNTPKKRFWTSSLLIDHSLFAWNMHFNLGTIYYDDIKNDNRFRLVRNNQ